MTFVSIFIFQFEFDIFLPECKEWNVASLSEASIVALATISSTYAFAKSWISSIFRTYNQGITRGIQKNSR